jgi:hypothetical protein
MAPDQRFFDTWNPRALAALRLVAAFLFLQPDGTPALGIRRGPSATKASKALTGVLAVATTSRCASRVIACVRMTRLPSAHSIPSRGTTKFRLDALRSQWTTCELPYPMSFRGSIRSLPLSTRYAISMQSLG